jgi:hypothetical protein
LGTTWNSTIAFIFILLMTNRVPFFMSYWHLSMFTCGMSSTVFVAHLKTELFSFYFCGNSFPILLTSLVVCTCRVTWHCNLCAYFSVCALPVDFLNCGYLWENCVLMFFFWLVLTLDLFSKSLLTSESQRYCPVFSF